MPPNGRRFQRGQSGNPGGLPKSHREVRALLLEHSPAALARLVELVQSDSEAVALAAACAVLDRAGLRPFTAEGERVEVVPGEGAGGAVERLAALLARRSAPPVDVPPS